MVTFLLDYNTIEQDLEHQRTFFVFMAKIYIQLTRLVVNVLSVDPQKLIKLAEILNPENLGEYCSMHPGWICDPSQAKDPDPPLPYFGDWLSSSRVAISTKTDRQFLGNPKEVRRGYYVMNLVPQTASPEAFFRFERIEERGTKGKTYYKIAGKNCMNYE